MSLLELKTYGCSVLRKQGWPVEIVTSSIQRLIDDMFETMYTKEGIGLAGPQVGVNQRVVVMDVGSNDLSNGPMVLINPEVIWSQGNNIGEEGCLSLPGITGDVKREAEVRLTALNWEGKQFEVKLDGIASRVVQHEIDHLNGILVIDHFTTVKRNLLRGQLRRLKHEGKGQSNGIVYLDA